MNTHSDEDYSRIQVALAVRCSSLCNGVHDDDDDDGHDDMDIVGRWQQRMSHCAEEFEDHGQKGTESRLV